jgi:hypothetical protein
VFASAVEQEGVGVLAGIDTHKDTLAVAVIDPAGRPVIVTEVANTEIGFDSLEELLNKHEVERVGIEGSGNYGRGAAVRLVLTGGLEVVEVPPSLTSRERTARPAGGKTDPGDAVAIARITAREPGLPRCDCPSGRPLTCGRCVTTGPSWSPSAPRWPAAPTPNCTACTPATRPPCRG